MTLNCPPFPPFADTPLPATPEARKMLPPLALPGPPATDALFPLPAVSERVPPGATVAVAFGAVTFSPWFGKPVIVSAVNPPVTDAPFVVAVREAPLMLAVAEIEVAPLTAPVSALAVMVPVLGASVPETVSALPLSPEATLVKFTEDAVTPVKPLPLPLRAPVVPSMVKAGETVLL